MKKIILVLTMILAAGPVMAQNADPSLLIREQFSQIDANGDGEISQAEFLAYKQEETKKITAKIFEKLDTDKSGGISEAEYAQTVNTILSQLKRLSAGLAQER